MCDVASDGGWSAKPFGTRHRRIIILIIIIIIIMLVIATVCCMFPCFCCPGSRWEAW